MTFEPSRTPSLEPRRYIDSLIALNIYNKQVIDQQGIERRSLDSQLTTNLIRLIKLKEITCD